MGQERGNSVRGREEEWFAFGAATTDDGDIKQGGGGCAVGKSGVWM